MKARSKKRLFVILTNHIFTIALVICAMVLCFECAFKGQSIAYMLDESNKSKSFEDTYTYQAKFEQCIADAIKMTVIHEQFETDGKFDGDKIIDIKNYANHKTLDYTEGESVTYYLKDLVRWGQIGFRGIKYMSATQYEELKNVLELRDPASNSINQEEYGYFEEYPGYVNNSFTEIKDGETYYMVLKDEFCLPSDEVPLIMHTESVAQYAEYSGYLQSTIDMLVTNYEMYRHFEAKFKESNFKFFISYETEGKVGSLSNLSGFQEWNESFTPEEITERFKNYGSYLCCAYENLSETVSNVKVDEAYVWSEFGKYFYAGLDNVRIWFAVDTRYSADDSFLQAKESYSYQHGWFKNVFVVSVILLFFILISYIVMAVLEEEVEKKCIFDRMHTETSILAGLILLFIPFIITTIGLKIYFGEVIGTIEAAGTLHIVLASVGLAIGTSVTNFALLSLYLSVIRRMKLGKTWSHSLTKKCVDLVRFLIHHPRILISTLLPYVGVIVVNALLIMLWVVEDNWGILLILFGLDTFVGYRMYLIKKREQELFRGLVQIKDGNFDYKLPTEDFSGDHKVMADAINQIGGSIKKAVEVSIKDEHLKTELITNVSHDLKTPLTSIITYIDLIKREKIDNKRVEEYVEILENKSLRLKQLTDDLVEASKISSGNIEFHMQVIDLNQMVMQAFGEFEDRFMSKNLKVEATLSETPALILADSAGIWRVVENLYGNIVKYALENTRVYLDIVVSEKVVMVLKNISAQKLSKKASDLTERFVRGDSSRTGEGSGLGLSIAESLIRAQGGEFDVFLDGDLFKVVITFDKAEPIDKLSQNAIMDETIEMSDEEKE